jgi:hypothetical protein
MAGTYIRSFQATMLACLMIGPAYSLGLADLTNQDAARGIKAALRDGAASAIGKLGRPRRILE